MNKRIIFFISLYLILISTIENCYAKHKHTWNNFLYFFGDATSVTGFTFKDKCILNSQPFSQSVSTGYSKKKHNPFLNIRAGRKSSSHTVIKCLGNMLNKNPIKNYFTFGHDPGHLNFAVEGDLTINNVTFKRIIVAQGHSTLNNWWFGGVNCVYKGNSSYDMVECTAENKITKWCFFRGKSPVDTDLNQVYLLTKTCKEATK
ncbi:MAG: hypothetical protein OXC48_08080 [Endozoicomonadaceae bacterium]|nr:hypothetical protein [Endozoicomonadaceae bacterium]